MRRHRPAAKRGAALIELALSMTLLMIIVGGVVDFGRFAYFYIALADGAGAGCRFACQHPFTTSTRTNWIAQVKLAVTAGMEGTVGFESNRLVIADPTLSKEPAPFSFDRVRVQAQYTFNTLVAWPLIPNQLTMVRAVEMRMIR